MKLLELVSKAYAQGPGAGGGAGEPDSNFRLDNFNFLNPFIPTDNADAATTFNEVFGQIVGVVLTIAALVAFFYLIVSGFQYITAGGDAAKAQTARQGVINALIGIVIILVSYLVLRYVGTLLNN